jgi:hypothetical protein
MNDGRSSRERACSVGRENCSLRLDGCQLQIAPDDQLPISRSERGRKTSARRAAKATACASATIQICKRTCREFRESVDRGRSSLGRKSDGLTTRAAHWASPGESISPNCFCPSSSSQSHSIRRSRADSAGSSPSSWTKCEGAQTAARPLAAEVTAEGSRAMTSTGNCERRRERLG